MAFYTRNAWWLGTGLVLTFGSAFGQTYFIALFANDIRGAFGLSNGQWGAIYTVATLMSAATLVLVGKLSDTVPLARLAVGVFVIYAASALLLMSASHVWMVVVGIFGLRFCGQGMMGNISMTALARWFRANRGRAIAVATLGYPLGEAVFPLVLVGALEAVGWRTGWGIIAAIILAVFLPAAFVLLRRDRTPQGEGGGEDAAGMFARHWTRGDVVRSASFWVLLPGVLAPPFIGTCAFFHVAHVSNVRGYDLATMALALPAYAVTVVATSLAVAGLVDRLGPARLVPFFLVPLAASMTVLAVGGPVWTWFAVLVLMGMSTGATIPITGALWPALYGTRWIGSVKALATAAMVSATAAGPGITGAIIDLGVPFPQQAPWLAAYCVVMFAVLVAVTPRYVRALA